MTQWRGNHWVDAIVWRFWLILFWTHGLMPLFGVSDVYYFELMGWCHCLVLPTFTILNSWVDAIVLCCWNCLFINVNIEHWAVKSHVILDYLKRGVKPRWKHCIFTRNYRCQYTWVPYNTTVIGIGQMSMLNARYSVFLFEISCMCMIYELNLNGYLCNSKLFFLCVRDDVLSSSDIIPSTSGQTTVYCVTFLSRFSCVSCYTLIFKVIILLCSMVYGEIK